MNVTTVLDTVVIFLWLLFAGLLALALTRATRGKSVKGMSAALLVTAIVAVILSSISAGLVFIQPEQRGVVISAVAPNGYREQPLQPGLNWIIPFFENVKIYPISRQTYTMSIAPSEGNIQGDDSITARTADGQEIFVDSSVIFAVDPAQVIKVHIEWQDRYVDGLVRPLSRGVIRDAVSQFGVEEVYSTKRDEMKQYITEALSQKLKDNGLLLVEFVLRNITFSPEYAASVEQKQIAEQLAQQARFVVEQRKQEAEQARQVAQGQADAAVIRARGDADARLIQAQAEAQALERLSQALKEQPELLQYTFINRLGPGVQTIFLPNNVPYLFPLPTGGASTAPGAFELLPTPLPSPTPLPTPTP
ncbi:MAG: SPFH domain-containing protein [Anaerolineales bacterium]|nr:SPFH domain-containing protein [Anaerolineales bacterium]